MPQGQWYMDKDINTCLKEKNKNRKLYHVFAATSADKEQLSSSIQEVLAELSGVPLPPAAVIPIRFDTAAAAAGSEEEVRWASLVLRRAAESGHIEALYNNPLGSPEHSLPYLKEILISHRIADERITTAQGSPALQGLKAADYGPWAVLSMDSLAKTGRLIEVPPGTTIENE